MTKRSWIILLLISAIALTAGVSAQTPMSPPADTRTVTDQARDSDAALAGWTWFRTPGTNAVFETPSNVNVVYKAWGPDGTINSGKTCWVHFPVQIAQKNGTTVYGRYIYVKFYVGSADVEVSAIHVWDGNVKVKEFTGHWGGPGYKTLTLDLGTNYKFVNGMTISMLTGAGVESMSHRFIAVSGGGRFFIP